MIEVIWATPLYEFLRQGNASPLRKGVLDCGAGGDHPPLSLFYHYGYRTHGIEIAEEALAKAQGFCRPSSDRVGIKMLMTQKRPTTTQASYGWPTVSVFIEGLRYLNRF